MASAKRKRTSIDTNEMDLGTSEARSFVDPVDADDSDVSLSEPDIVVVGARGFSDHAKELAFMEEKVVIQIDEGREEHPLNPVPITVQGRQIMVWRNQPTLVRRKFVERLARCKERNYSNKKIRDDNGNDQYIYPSTNSLLFPFHVLKDSPEGFAWLQKVLRES